MTYRPCLDCSEAIPSGTRCSGCKPPAPPKVRPRGHPHANGGAWKRISKAARKAQPFCLDCGRTDKLHADHIIPYSVRPDLALEQLNITVRCEVCNGRRGNRYTEAEAEAVLTAIAARRARWQRYALSQSG